MKAKAQRNVFSSNESRNGRSQCGDEEVEDGGNDLLQVLRLDGILPRQFEKGFLREDAMHQEIPIETSKYVAEL